MSQKECLYLFFKRIISIQSFIHDHKYKGHISSKFSINSKESASELFENLHKIFPQYYTDSCQKIVIRVIGIIQLV